MIDKKFKTDTIVSYLSQAGVVLCGFAFTTLVTKFAGIGVFGMLGMLTAFSSVLTNLLTFRTNEAIVVFYKRGESTGDMGFCKFALLAGICLDIAVGCLLLVFVYQAAGPIAGYLLREPNTEPVVRLFAFTLFFQFFRGAPLGYLIARERFIVVNLFNLSEHLIKIGLLATMLLRGQNLDFHVIVLVGLLASFAASLASYGYLLFGLFRRYTGVRTKLSRALIKEYLGFSLNTFLSTALKAGNQNIDTLILGLVTDNRLVGIYALFRQFLAPLAFLSNPFATLAYPKFVQAVIERRQADIRKSILSVNAKLFRSYLAALLIIMPLLVGYGLWVDLKLKSVEYFAFVTMGGTAILGGLIWWARPFSNAVNPNYSLQGNFFASLFLLLFIYPATAFAGIQGTAIVMLMLGLGNTWFWWRKLSKS